MPATAFATTVRQPEPVAVCGSCFAVGAYVVPGRDVVRCPHCPARRSFEPTGCRLSDLWGAAVKLEAPPARRGLRW